MSASPRFLLQLALGCLLSIQVLFAQAPAPSPDLFAQNNLAAWCIVPFDAKKRGPEERAAMLEKLGLRQFVYDYRKEHIPQWDEELTALKRHHIALVGWWFPGSLNDEARQTLALFQRHDVSPQLWVTGNGGAITVTSPEDQAARIAKEVQRLKPICEAAAPLGCKVALYNHGAWFGEPENAIAIVTALKASGIQNVGLVYNLHHGHAHLDRLEKVLPQMLPHLLFLNLNGMDQKGDTKGRKILPLGIGTEDIRVLRIIRASGYSGPIGLLNHTDEDAEGRLLDNLDGLRWLLPQLDDAPPGPKPTYRTWKETSATSPSTSKSTASLVRQGTGVPSINEEFGKALSGGLLIPGSEAYRTLPLTIECRARLNSKDQFNILAACDPKNSSTHWELYTYAGSGFFSLYLPGRGGEYRSNVNICDGQWHNLIANIEEHSISLWVDGKLVLEKPIQPLKGTSQPGDLALGRLVEGTLGCDGLIDDVRLSRGVMKPRKGEHPRQRMDITIGLWHFNDLTDRPASAADLSIPPPPPFHPPLAPLDKSMDRHWKEFVNRERVFDFYAKEVLEFLKQKPAPQLLPAFTGLDGGQQGHWGNQNDKDTWNDGRWSRSDLGTVFSAVFKGGGQTLLKGVAIRIGDNGEFSACFDPLSLTFPLVWKDDFIKLSDARHGFMNGAGPGGKVTQKSPPPTPPAAAVYHGFYRNGNRTLFSYSIGGTTYLDTAWVKDGKWTQTRAEAATHPDKDLIKGGPAQWPAWLETQGTLGTEEPFATDTLTIPYENPYGTLFFITGHDFIDAHTAAITTMTGEVWLVRGIDEKLSKLRWKRYATGLHQPLGVKVWNNKLYVLGRDQITCLQDLNGDDEADFYECVTNAMITSPGGHDFITGLDIDKKGRFYFASANQGLCRLTLPDQIEVLATGFRNPNGLGFSPDERFLTTSVQEGDWTPASAICRVELGKNEGAHFGAGGPKNGQPPEPPLLQLPRGEDNSAGGQAFISGESWKSLVGEGNLVHFSTGSGSAFLVMPQQIQGVSQSAALKISGNFDSGVQAGRFHTADGHLYATGMQGWGSYTPKDGCFQRLRFTGDSTPVPTAVEARDNGVLIRYNRKLDAATASKAANHFAQCWNYNYSAAYGSPELSVRYADTVGHDPLEVRSAHLLEDSKALFLEIPQILPASQIHLHTAVTARSQDLFLTAHALAPAFTEFPGYTKIAKIQPAAASKTSGPTSLPNPWAKGEPGRAIQVEAALGLQFVQKTLTAKPGEALSLTFRNPDVVPHNWMLAKPGTLQTMGNLTNLMITDPKGLAKHYVPESPDVLTYTDMVNPGQSFTIHFHAPQQKGEYPYLCTFPGHWMVMNGILRVE